MRMKLGWIGVGNLGAAIVSRLLEAGWEMHIYNRTKGKAQALIDAGCHWCESPQEMSKVCDSVFICVSGKAAMESVLWDTETGLCHSQMVTKTIVDTSTISPDDAKYYTRKIFENHDVHYLTCPVSGGAQGALNGTLAAILAGQSSAVEAHLKIIRCFADKITRVEHNAKAQQLKILNNLAESINLCGALEVLQAGKALGCDLHEMEQAFTTCRGRSAYMQVAIDFIKSGSQTSQVGLDVRLKDLNFAKTLIGEGFHVSERVMALFDELLAQVGVSGDQCDYSKLVGKPINIDQLRKN